MTKEILRCKNCKHRILLRNDQYIHRVRAYSDIESQNGKCGIGPCQCTKPKLGAKVVYND